MRPHGVTGLLKAPLRRLKRAARHRLLPNWRGICPICETPARFVALGPWYRDQLVCTSCHSIPRERALMAVLQMVRPDWRSLRIHESSPGGRGVSPKLRRDCPGYVESQYDRSVPFGTTHPTAGYRSEDLESQTFEDSIFDVVITQDVFEHLFDPARAIREIARTLRPNGVYVMTVPLVNKERPSRRRAALVDREIRHLAEPQYHYNPVDELGSLVTVDWGYDIAGYLHAHSGLQTSIVYLDDMQRGIRAEYIDVVVCRKAGLPTV